MLAGSGAPSWLTCSSVPLALIIQESFVLSAPSHKYVRYKSHFIVLQCQLNVRTAGVNQCSEQNQLFLNLELVDCADKVDADVPFKGYRGLILKLEVAVTY